MSAPVFRFVWLLSAALVASVVSADERPSSPEAVVRQLFETLNRHDLDAMAAMYAADAVILTPDHPAPLRGPAGIRAEIGPLFAQFPDIQDRVLNVTAQGDRVAMEFVSSGCASPGKNCFELPIASFLTVRNGLIVRDASYFDVPPGEH